MAKKQSKKAVTLESVAGMVQRGFDEVHTSFDIMENRFEGVEKRFDNVDKRLDGVDERLRTVEAKLDRALYTSISNLEARVKRLEEKAGIRK